MSDEKLQQKYLNVTTRGMAYMDIMMYVPDNSVHIGKISCDDVLSYSNIDSIGDIKNYNSTTIATLEENLWLLNGGFVNPTLGRKYNGYISNSISNEVGQFKTNPIINIDLSTISNIEYFSIILNPAVKTGYPKQVKLSCLDNNGELIGDVFTKNIQEETSLPNLVYEVNLNNVASLKLEFVDTVTPYRRIRVASIMFGKVITLTQDEVLNTHYEDKCSFVPDTIPSRVFDFTLENYDQRYNIDNPENGYVDLDRQTMVMIRNGYNIYGYTETEDGMAEINNPDRVLDIAWDDWKELRLLNISTDDEDTCTIECGSILDMMTDVYTGERFTNNRTVRNISTSLLSFMGLNIDTVQFSTDDNGKSYGDYIINTVLPELPVRELFQLLAFSVGATLLIKDDGTIKFANLKLDDPASFTHHHKFTYNDFESVPAAEQLENTTNISLPKYNSSIGTSEDVITTTTVSAVDVEISYQDCVPTGARVAEDDKSGGSVASADLYAHRGILKMNLPQEGSAKVEIYGYQIDTVKTQDRSVTKDTLIIDTQLISSDTNNNIKKKYQQWYGKKFKYSMSTRGEPLVDAADYAEIQTPFSGDKNLIKSFVLMNSIDFDGSWSGKMEVIAL